MASRRTQKRRQRRKRWKRRLAKFAPWSVLALSFPVFFVWFGLMFGWMNTSIVFAIFVACATCVGIGVTGLMKLAESLDSRGRSQPQVAADEYEPEFRLFDDASTGFGEYIQEDMFNSGERTNDPEQLSFPS